MYGNCTPFTSFLTKLLQSEIFQAAPRSPFAKLAIEPFGRSSVVVIFIVYIQHYTVGIHPITVRTE